MKKFPYELIVIIIRIALGAIFTYAGIIKIMDPVAFAGSIAAYKILPYFGNYLAAAILPWLEVTCGLLLVAGYRWRGAAVIILVLNAGFIVALASTLVRGLDIDCGCFRQGGDKTSAWAAIGRDMVLLFMALAVLRQKDRSPP